MLALCADDIKLTRLLIQSLSKTCRRTCSGWKVDGCQCRGRSRRPIETLCHVCSLHHFAFQTAVVQPGSKDVLCGVYQHRCSCGIRPSNLHGNEHN